MKYKKILHLEKKLCPVAFGAGNIEESTKEEGKKLLDTFLDMGGSIIDTANIYGRWLPSGENESEKVIGEWLNKILKTEKTRSRDDMVISTKGAHPSLDEPEKPRMSKEQILHDIKDSLRTLGLDYIDIYWLHRDAPGIAEGEIMEIMTDIRKQGYIKTFGLSNWEAKRVKNAYDYLQEKGKPGLFGVQNRWSLASMNPGASEDKTLVSMSAAEYRLYTKTDLVAMPYSAMGKGYFSKLDKTEKKDLDPGLIKYYDNVLNDQRMEALRKMRRERGIEISKLVLAFLISQPFTVIPITRPRTVKQITQSMDAMDIKLSPHDINTLSRGVLY